MDTCSSLVEIRSVTSEIRRRKKEERKIKNHSGKIYVLWHHDAVRADKTEHIYKLQSNTLSNRDQTNRSLLFQETKTESVTTHAAGRRGGRRGESHASTAIINATTVI